MIRSLLTLLVLVIAHWWGPVCARQVYVYQSQNTHQYFKSNGGSYDRLTNPWYLALDRIGQRYTKIDAAGLARVSEPGVLILPSTIAVGVDEQKLLRELTARGWSFFATWAFGARDQSGTWLGYGAIEEFFQSRVVVDFDLKKNGGWFLFPVGESPMTQSLRAGERIFINKVNEPLMLVQPMGEAQLSMRGGDWTRLASMGFDRSGIATFTEQGRSRLAFWGLPETAWDSAQKPIDTVIRDSLTWLKRELAAVKSSWPHPYQSAYLVEMDTEDQFANATTLMELLESRRWSGTFYMVTGIAMNHTDLVKRIGKQHEVGYHAEVHDGFKGLSLEAQEQRLRTMVTQMTSILGDSRVATGFRAPLESFDDNTDIALRKQGLRHHVGSMNSGDALLPEFSKAEPNLGPQQAIVVFPRGQLDDINLVRMGVSDTNRIAQILVDNANDVILLRGFGLLSVHSQYMARGSPLVNALPRLFDRLADPKAGVWVATGSQFERWWRSLGQVRVTTQVQGGRINVSIFNAGTNLSNFKLTVLSTGLGRKPTTNLAGVQWVQLDNYRWAMVFADLKPGQQNLTIQFN